MKMTNKFLMIVAAASLAAGGQTFAEEDDGKGKKPRGEGKRGRPSPEKMVEMLDKDSDQKVSLEEFKNSRFNKDRDTAQVEKRFNMMDGDDDGYLTVAEIGEAQKKMRRRRGGEGGKGRRGGKGGKGDDS